MIADVHAASGARDGGPRLGDDPALFWAGWIGMYGLTHADMADLFLHHYLEMFQSLPKR